MIMIILAGYFSIAVLYYLYCVIHDYLLYRKSPHSFYKFKYNSVESHQMYIAIALLWIVVVFLLIKVTWEGRHEKTR